MKTVLKKSTLEEIAVSFSSNLLTSPFSVTWCDFKAFWSYEIKEDMAVTVQTLNTVFMRSVIHIYLNK